MRVFVTGGTGFVGKPTVGRLLEGGKAERELGLSYTPIGAAIEEEVASHKGTPEVGRIS